MLLDATPVTPLQILSVGLLIVSNCRVGEAADIVCMGCINSGTQPRNEQNSRRTMRPKQDMGENMGAWGRSSLHGPKTAARISYLGENDYAMR